jgi:hypothetical protein
LLSYDKFLCLKPKALWKWRGVGWVTGQHANVLVVKPHVILMGWSPGDGVMN